MATPDPTNQPTQVPRRRRAIRLTLLILIIAALTALAASLQLSGRGATSVGTDDHDRIEPRQRRPTVPLKNPQPRPGHPGTTPV